MAPKGKAGGKPGRKKVHRLHVMANIEDGARAIAAIPLWQPGTPYPLGLSLQRLHGPSFGGETGFVIRALGADGNIATLVVRPGKDPSTVQFAQLRDADAVEDPTRPTGEGADLDPLPGEDDPDLQNGGHRTGSGMGVG